MDVKYLNPFIEAFIKVSTQLGITDVKRSSITKKERMQIDLDITSVIGLVGDVRGNVTWSFSHETALKFISKMMMGMPVDKIDAMGRSAIGEFANMMTGNASTLLAAQKIITDMSPPSIIAGKDILFIISNIETISITFDTSLGQVEANFGLEI